jgi:Carboxypeptidase regulatory-like domain
VNELTFEALDLSALKTGASITTLVGLLGFIVACVFLSYLARTRAETKRLELLPSKDRAKVLDPYLLRYKLNLTKLPDERRYDLVVREMNLRSRKQLVASTLGAAVFVSCVAIIAFGTPAKINKDFKPSVRTKAAETMTAKVRGRVLNEAGDPIAGVKVSVVMEGLETEAVTTGQEGGFSLPAHADHGQMIKLRAEKPGFRAREQEHPAGTSPAEIVLERD